MICRHISGALVFAALCSSVFAQQSHGSGIAAPVLAAFVDRASQHIHIVAGHSIIMKTANRLKRVYVSNSAAIDSFTSSPSQIVVTAKAPGVSSLVLWDETGESQTYAVSADVDVANLQKDLRAALPYERVVAEAEQDRISLSGTVTSEASSELAGKLASLYGKNVVNALLVRPPHVRQVKLRVQMIEVDRGKLDQLGFNIFSIGNNISSTSTGQFQSISTVASSSGSSTNTGVSALTVTDPLNILFYNTGLNLGATIKDLQNKQVLQILAEPTITTLSGKKASFLSGGEFPFPVVQGASGGLTSVTIQFRPYGVKLDFLPEVNPDGSIHLQVEPEVSALDYTNAVQIAGYTIPAISTRRAETQVELRDGQSFAISGLLDRRTTDILERMPGIADVPIIGQLFRSKSVNHSIVELLVIVTPTVVDPLTDTSQPTLPILPIAPLDKSIFDKSIGSKTPNGQSQTRVDSKQ